MTLPEEDVAGPPGTMRNGARGQVHWPSAWRTQAARLLATEWRVFFVVVVGVLVTRLPFIDAGYGSIRDAWRVARSARLIATTHEYWASRTPPHPVHEIASAFIWQGGALALNLATAIVSAVGIGLFALTMRRLEYRNWAVATLALAFTPQIYVASTTTIDYMWALSFVLAALYFTLRRRPVVAGVLVGLAIGSRITSALALVPLSLLLAQRHDRRLRLAAILQLCGVALALGALLFAPAFARYGMETLRFAEAGDVTPYQVLRKATLETWGGVGMLGIGVACAYQLALTARKRPRRFRLPRGSYAHVWLLAVVVYAIAFVRLPHLPAYLIPAIPFVLLLLHELLDRTPFVLACAALVVSPFVGIGPSGFKDGPIFHDRTKRIALMESARRFVEVGNALPGRNVIVVGHWRSPLRVYALDHPDDSSTYVYLLTAEQASRLRQQGVNLYYLPGQRQLNLERNGFDLRDYGARPLP